MHASKRFTKKFSSTLPLAAFLMIEAAGVLAVGAASTPPITPMHQLATGTEVYNYINFAWGKKPNLFPGTYTYTYGMDFGQTLWGDYAVAANPQIANDLDAMKAAGVEGIRWFVIPDGRNLTFDASGVPTGRGAGFQEDLWTAMDLLEARQMGAVFTLLDGNAWFKPETVVSGIPFGHARVITDSGQRQALYATVIIPILQDLAAWQAARPGHAFPVSAIDLGNELEFGTDPYQRTGATMSDMQAYVREAAALVHQYLPGIPVTIGAASARTLVDDWTDQALQVAAGQGMDLYSFHHFGTELLQGPGNLKDQYGLDRLGKRIYLQEFPGKNAPLGAPEMYLAPVGGTRSGRLGEGWLSGSALWSFNGANDVATPLDPVATLQGIAAWFSSSFDVPDLTILALAYPPLIARGTPVQFQLTIANAGGVHAGVHAVEAWLDGVRLDSMAMPILAPGERMAVTLPITPWTATVGVHDLWSKTDVFEEVAESREGNNVVTSRFTVGPDLVITSLTYPGAPTVGTPVSFVVTVKNQGTSASGGNVFGLWLDGVRLASAITPALAAGQSATLTVPSIPWTATNGQHNLWAKTDTGLHVAEADETNNVWTAMLAVAGP